MSTDPIDLAKKRFAVSITEIREELVVAEEFSGQYTTTVTLSDGSARTLELSPVMRHGEMFMELKDTGHRSFMGMIPVRTARHTNGKLSVRVYDLDDVDAAWAEFRSRRLASSPVLPPETSLVSNPDFVPPGFTHGVEILNDNTTHMKFVVDVLHRHVGLSEEDSHATMLTIHRRGGVLIPMASLADAERVAAQITAEAANAGYPFICRAASVSG